MGIDIEGGMVLGEQVKKLKLPEDVYVPDFVDDNNMTHMSPWFDADPEEWTIGFKVKDVAVSDMTEEWFDTINTQAKTFKALTGTLPKLIGMQTVW